MKAITVRDMMVWARKLKKYDTGGGTIIFNIYIIINSAIRALNIDLKAFIGR